MRYDLKEPCKHCPFGIADTRIFFSGVGRATEIAESAYRNGFPCHKSAVNEENDDGEDSGYVPGPNTQHCAGAIGMFINDGNDCGWPGIGNSERRAERLAQKIDLTKCFDSEADFIEANKPANHPHNRAKKRERNLG